MEIYNINNQFTYETEKLCRIFLPFEKIVFVDAVPSGDSSVITKLEVNGSKTDLYASVTLFGKTSHFTDTVDNGCDDYDKECERVLALCLYECFVSITGYRAEWGILTGIRPAKLYSSFVRIGGQNYADEFFRNGFKVSDEKISLCRETSIGERKIVEASEPHFFSLYISVPFCPTRCSYCSFVSHSVEKAKKLIPEYVKKLVTEIERTAEIADKCGLVLKTVYIGGGTPTTLTAEELGLIMKTVSDNFDMSNVSEYTVEAGRPDTVDEEKLISIKKGGATRISINPQTMNDNVLNIIGRRHTSAQMIDAFTLARQVGFDNINTDLIAGLPGDTLDSFKRTVDTIKQLGPENITVHALSMKRASGLTKSGGTPGFDDGTQASQMVRYARKSLSSGGIYPYYMYRQSKTVGNLENVGYSKPGYECEYNVYIMDETHSILACGASAVTKLRQPYGDYIERIFNFKYPYEYISRFDEIIARKEQVIPFYEKYPVRY